MDLKQKIRDIQYYPAGFAATTALILNDINITDVTQTLKDVIGIVPPVMFAMIAVVVAIGIMVMILAVTGLMPKLLNSLMKKLDGF